MANALAFSGVPDQWVRALLWVWAEALALLGVPDLGEGADQYFCANALA